MRLAAALLALLAACGGAPRAANDAAPVHYAVPAHVGDLVTDDAAFARFAAPVRADAEAAVRGRGDPRAKDELFVLAMLDALADHWPDAVAKLDRIRAVETDPVKAAMTGFTIRVGADAHAHGNSATDAYVYSYALERQLAALPVDRVRDELAMLRAMGQTFTPAVCKQLVEDAVGPHARANAVDFSDAQTIIFQRYAAVDLFPVGVTIDRILASHGIELPKD